MNLRTITTYLYIAIKFMLGGIWLVIGFDWLNNYDFLMGFLGIYTAISLISMSIIIFQEYQDECKK